MDKPEPVEDLRAQYTTDDPRTDEAIRRLASAVAELQARLQAASIP